MATQKNLEELAVHVSRMQQNGLQEPYEAIDIFFGDFPLIDTRKQLWELYHGWVMSERSRNCDPQLPANLLFFYTHLEMLVEAAWLVHQEQKQSKK